MAASDGDIGHVSGFVVDDSDWAISHLVIDARSYWPGKHVLVPTDRIEAIDWTAAKVRMNAAKAEIKDSPPYDPHSLRPSAAG